MCVAGKGPVHLLGTRIIQRLVFDPLQDGGDDDDGEDEDDLVDPAELKAAWKRAMAKRGMDVPDSPDKPAKRARECKHTRAAHTRAHARLHTPTYMHTHATTPHTDQYTSEMHTR